MRLLMKSVIGLTILLDIGIVNLKAQVITCKDTVICIVDTTNSYVTFRKNPYDQFSEDLWQISIKGHYYDSIPEEDDSAAIVFENDFSKKSRIKDTSALCISVNDVNDKDAFVADKWIHQQTSFYTLKLKLGLVPWDNCNFLIFKQDIQNSKDGFVKAHRVSIGYYEVQY